MAERLTSSCAYRVTFAPGTAPGAKSAHPSVVEMSTTGAVSLDGAAAEWNPDGHQVLVTSLDVGRTAASGVHRLEVVIDGWRFELDVDSERRARLRERVTSARSDAARGGPHELRAIIPGRVVSVEVAEGDVVETGGRLLVLEAMKMQNELKAPRAGTVARVAVGSGHTVEVGDLLVVIE